MQKLCIAFYMVLGAILGLWLAFVPFAPLRRSLVGEPLSVMVGVGCGLLVSCLAGSFVRVIWSRASVWQRAYLATLGALTIATLLGVGVIAWIYVVNQQR